MNTYTTFHGDSDLKEFYLNRLKTHAKKDEFIKGKYWRNGRGCGVGCTVHSSDPHAMYPIDLGIPESIAYLEDNIFENLPLAEAKNFPLKFIQSIEVGANLSQVISHFFIWLLVDPKSGVIRFSEENTKVNSCIRQVANLYTQRISGNELSPSAWSTARSDADSAFRLSAMVGAETAALCAEESTLQDFNYPAYAGYAAKSAARCAAEATIGTRAWRESMYKSYRAMAKKLLSLLSEAPIMKGGEQ